jgi:hypothetical protein
MGWPSSAQRCGLKDGGCVQQFDSASIHWTPSTGAQRTDGAIRDLWESLGWESGVAGYPIADAVTQGSVRKQSFQGGEMTWSASDGARFTEAVKFTDIEGLGFQQQIQWLAARGVTLGWAEADGTRTYRPQEAVKRDSMAAFLYRLAGSPEFTPPAVSPFRDVPTTHVFYKEIAWLADSDISEGWTESDGTLTYRPDEAVKRDAMAAFLYRADHQPAYTAPANSYFSDIGPQTLFYKEMSWLASEEISTGWVEAGGARTYRPGAEITREHMAAFMYRSVQ